MRNKIARFMCFVLFKRFTSYRIGAHGRTSVINGGRAEVPAETFADAHPSGCAGTYPRAEDVILVMSGIWYRENVLSGTKSLVRCVLCRLNVLPCTELVHTVGHR